MAGSIDHIGIAVPDAPRRPDSAESMKAWLRENAAS